MIATIAFFVILFGLVAVACWAGSGGETSGKAGDSTGSSGGAGAGLM